MNIENDRLSQSIEQQLIDKLVIYHYSRFV